MKQDSPEESRRTQYAHPPASKLQKAAQERYFGPTDMSDVFSGNQLADVPPNNQFLTIVEPPSSSQNNDLGVCEENSFQESEQSYQQEQYQVVSSDKNIFTKKESYSQGLLPSFIPHTYDKDSILVDKSQKSQIQYSENQGLKINLEIIFDQESVERQKNLIKNIFRLLKKELQKIKKKKTAMTNSQYFKLFEQQLRVCGQKKFNFPTLKKILVEDCKTEKEAIFRRFLSRKILSQHHRQDTLGNEHKKNKQRYLVGYKPYLLRFINKYLLERGQLK